MNLVGIVLNPVQDCLGQRAVVSAELVVSATVVVLSAEDRRRLLEEYVAGGFGTSDCVILGDGHMYVMVKHNEIKEHVKTPLSRWDWVVNGIVMRVPQRAFHRPLQQ